jgi:hypothetical protein
MRERKIHVVYSQRSMLACTDNLPLLFLFIIIWHVICELHNCYTLCQLAQDLMLVYSSATFWPAHFCSFFFLSFFSFLKFFCVQFVLILLCTICFYWNPDNLKFCEILTSQVNCDAFVSAFIAIIDFLNIMKYINYSFFIL